MELTGTLTPNGTLTATLSTSVNIVNNDLHYTHEQRTAAAVWEIVHNLGKYPSVTVVDSGGSVVVGEVQYIDTRSLIITFSAAFAGSAYLN